jgi:DNA integrity scanning protein DisA with diadenylate cyclase activity
VKMLMEVTRVTAAAAEAVVREVGSVERLVMMLEVDPEALEDVEIGRVAGNKKVGKALSRRLRNVFCGADETAMDNL